LQNVCQNVFDTWLLKEEKCTGGKMNFTESKNCLDFMKWIELNKYRIRVTHW